MKVNIILTSLFLHIYQCYAISLLTQVVFVYSYVLVWLGKLIIK